MKENESKVFSSEDLFRNGFENLNSENVLRKLEYNCAINIPNVWLDNIGQQ